jgi:arsenical pump membrane protein
MSAHGHWATWTIAALATGGVIVRPFSWPEWIWAVLGAAALVASGLLPVGDALAGVRAGTDVYLFLLGMMLLAELARREGLFDWMAARAASAAGGSASLLFTLVYLVGTVVTVFLSNDATAVVLTPAVAAVVRAAEAPPLPYLLVCAFIANAASFVLPISNPANLVIYGRHMPPLLTWLPRFALPSVAAIGLTYVVLRGTQRRVLRGSVAASVEVPSLSTGGRTAAIGIVATGIVLLASSALGLPLGLPTFLAGVATAAVVIGRSELSVVSVLRGIAWGVLPLVAGLFVLVEALGKTGVTTALASLLQSLVRHGAALAASVTGVVLAVACNLANNLPVGLVSGRVVQSAHVPDRVRAAVLIGVDLGPNLSVTGSLATILWLTALRREGLAVSGWQFLKIGVLVMPPALLGALATALALG